MPAATLLDPPRDGSHAAPAANARFQKGRQTHVALLDHALGLAARRGLEGLTIGALAESIGMSKSGVFAHFGSREELQISVIREYHQRFEDEVVRPALREPRGLPRLRAMVERWMRRVHAEASDGGCIYISGAVEFDDRPGAVRDALHAMVMMGLGAFRRAIEQARASGHLDAALDPDQILFEIQSLVLGLHHDSRFLGIPGTAGRAFAALDHLLARASVHVRVQD